MENDVLQLRPAATGEQVWFSQAVSSFEVDSLRACRALRVSMAVNVFGVGTLLPNDLGDRADLSGRSQETSRAWKKQY
jgi:hypothetical protein